MKPGEATRADEIRAWKRLGDAASILRALPRCEGDVRRLAYEALQQIDEPIGWAMLQVFSLGRHRGMPPQQALQEVWQDLVLAALAAGLENEAPRCRALSARALGELERLEALKALLGKVLNESTQLARVEMLRAIERLSDLPGARSLTVDFWARAGRWDEVDALGEGAIEPLAAIVEDAGEQDADTRQLRLDALRACRRLDPGASVELAGRVLAVQDPALRAAAIEILGATGEARWVAPLIDQLEGSEERVRRAAFEALRRLGGAEAIAALQAHAARCEGDDERRSVGEVLARMGAVDVLVALLAHPLPAQRAAAAAALGRSGAPEGVEALTQALDDAYPEVRAAARGSLEQLGWRPLASRRERRSEQGEFWMVPADWGAAPGPFDQAALLRRGLSSAEPSRRWLAADGLALLRDPAAEPQLRQLLDDPDTDVRISAARALVALGVTAEDDARWAPYLALEGQWDRVLRLGVVALPGLAAATRELAPALRRGAAATLGRLGLPEGVALLAPLLEDPVADVRLNALRALGDLGGSEAVAAVLPLLEHEDLAPEAAEALPRMGAAALEPLSASLAAGSDAARRWAAQALGALGERAAAAALIRAAEDPSPGLRQEAARALGRVNGPTSLVCLRDLLRQDPEWRVRRVAAEALGRLADPKALPLLRLALGDSFSEVRLAARAALEQMGQPAEPELLRVAEAIRAERWAECLSGGEAALELLLHVLGERETDGHTVARRVAAARTLGALGDERALPALLGALDDVQPAVQAAAAAALGPLGQPTARPALKLRLANRNPQIRAAALEALAMLGVAEARAEISRALNDPEAEVRFAAAKALGQQQAAALESLLEALRSTDEAVRCQAAEGLGAVGSVDAIDPLVLALADPARPVRQAAERALRTLGWVPVGWRTRRRDRGYAFWTERNFWLQGDPAATQVELLVAALEDSSNPERQRNAAEALGRVGDPAGRAPLRALLAHDDDDLRIVACQALVELGEVPGDDLSWASYWAEQGAFERLLPLGPDAAPAIAGALGQADPRRRSAAAAALGELASPAVAHLLLPALVDPEATVRVAAARAAARLHSPRLVDPLVALLADPEVAEDAVDSLASLGALALPALIAALQGEPRELQPGAALALGRSGLEEALAPLTEACRSDAPATRAASCQALGTLGRAAAGGALETALRNDPEATVREAAALALGAVGDRERIPALRGSLADAFAEVRRAALRALDALGAPPTQALLDLATAIDAGAWDRCLAAGPIAHELLLRVLDEPGADPATQRRREAAARLLGELRCPGVAESLRALSQTGPPGLSAAACEGLGALGDEEERPLLESLLGAQSALVRKAAATALGRLGAGPSVARLRSALSDPDEGVRVAATQALGLEAEVALAELLAALDSPDPAVRQAACEGLGGLGRVEAVDPLVDRLSDSQGPVALAARRALEQLGWIPIGWRSARRDAGYAFWTHRGEWLREDPAAPQGELLQQALRQSEEPARRRVAAEGLGLLGDLAAEPALRAALADPDRDVRVVAAQSLVEIGVEPGDTAPWLAYWIERGEWAPAAVAAAADPVAALLELDVLARDPWPERRRGALRCLAALPAERGLPGLLRGTEDSEPALRAAALDALGARPEALDPAVELLADPATEPAARATLRALGSAAVPALQGALESERASLAAAAARLLPELAPDTAPDLVLRALDHPAGPLPRRAAAEALASFGPSARAAAVQVAARLEREEEAEVRAALVACLGALGDPATQPSLQARLGDRNAAVRRACAQALSDLGSPPDPELLAAAEAVARGRWRTAAGFGSLAAPLLISASHEPGDDREAASWRAGAAAALGEVGDPLAVPRLRELLSDPHERVREAAAQALGALGDGASGELLAGLFSATGASLALRLACVRGLAAMGGAAAQAVLLRAIESDEPELRAAAARALGSPEVSEVDRLIEALVDDDAEVRRGAALQLGELGELRAIDALILLLYDTQPSVRLAARQALVALGWHPVGWRVRPGDRGYAYWTSRAEWLEGDFHEPQVSLLLKALAAPDPDRRRNAVEALGLAGSLAAWDGLQQAAEQDDDPAVRQAAQDALDLLAPARAERAAALAALRLEFDSARSAGEDPAALLRRRVDAGPPEVAAAAVALGGELPEGAALELLREVLLSKRSPELRVAAAETLGALGGPPPIPLLLEALGDAALSPTLVRQLAARGAAAAPGLLELLTAGPEEARPWAALALGRGSAAEAVAPLLDAIRAPSERLRAAAATALGSTRSEEALPALAEALLGDPVANVRAKAAAAMGFADAASETLLLALVDDASEVRNAASGALAALGTPDATELATAAAALCAGDPKPALRAGPGMDRVLQRALRGSTLGTAAVQTAVAAARALAERGSHAADAELVAVLGSPAPELQEAAAAALGSLRAAPAVAALSALAERGAAGPRAAALLALAEIGAKDLEARIRDALAAPDRSVQRAALRACAGLGAAGSALLLPALRAEVPELRAGAAEALGRLGEASAIEALIPLLEDPAPEVCAAARSALEALGWGPVDRKLRLRALLAALAEADGGSRLALVTDLGMLGDPDALPALRDLQRTATDRDLQVTACRALAALGESPGLGREWLPYWIFRTDWERLAAMGEDAVDALAEQLGSPVVERRAGATEALGRIGGQRVIPGLLQAILDPEAQVRRAAARAMVALRPPDALEPLLALLGDEACQDAVADALAGQGDAAGAALLEQVRTGPTVAAQGAAAALAQMPGVDALPALSEALLRPEPAVRRAAAEALGRRGDPQAGEALLRCLGRDPSAAARAAAARSLGRLRVAAAIPALRACLGEGFLELRTSAEEGLELLGAPPEAALLEAARLLRGERWDELARAGAPAAELLLHALNNRGLDSSSGSLRAKAAETLARSGVRAALPPICGLLHDPLPRVRLAACGALRLLADPRGLEPLLECSRDLLADLRAAALRALEPLSAPAVDQRILEALDDPEPRVQETAFELLAQRDPAEATTRLAQRLLGSPAEESKLDTLARLVALGRAEAIDPIMAELGDARPAVRHAAEAALRSLGWVPVGWRNHPSERGYSRWTLRAEWLGDDPAAPQTRLLLDALRGDPDPQRRRVAAEGLGRCEGAGLADALREALRSEGDPEVRTALCQALVDQGQPAERDPLWLGYWLARGAWAEIAAQGEAMVPPLRAALADPEPARRLGALGALARIPGTLAAEAVASALDRDDDELKAAALEALVGRADASLVPQLVALLAVPALAPLARRVLEPLLEAALPALEQALRAGPALQRRAAAALVAKARGPRAEALLGELAADDDATLRGEALRGLTLQRAPRALDLALAALPGELEPPLRALAATLLADLHDLAPERVQDSLRAALADAWTEVASAAQRSLERCGAPAEPALLAAAEAIARGRWADAAVPAAVPLLLYVLADGETDPSVTQRKVQAVRVLAELRHPASRGALVELLRAEEGRLRAAAARALGSLGEPDLAPLLGAVYDGAPDDAELRAAAVLGAGELDPSVSRGLLARALSDPDARVRDAALEALGESRSVLVAELILGLRSAHEGLRIRAAQELGKTKDRRAIDPLVLALGDAVPAVRKAATGALSSLGWQPIGWRARPEDEGYAYWTLRSEWVADDPEEPQVSLLLRALDEDDDNRRRVAAEGLGLIGSPIAAAALQRVAENDPAPAVRKVAALALHDVLAVAKERERALAALRAELDAAGASAPEFLQGALESSLPERRLAAVALLGEIPSEQSFPLLASLLSAPDLELRAQALGVLERSAGKRAWPLLVELLDAPALAASAAAALGRAGKRAAALLAPSLSPDTAPLRRRWAATALGLCADPAQAEALRPLLRDPVVACRVAAAEALGRLGQPEDLAALAALVLEDGAARVRAAAARALGELGLPEAGTTLLDALADVDSAVVDAARGACEALQLELPVTLLAAVTDLRAGDYAACAGRLPEGPALLRRALAAPQELPDSAPRFSAIAATCARTGDVLALPALRAALTSGEVLLQLAAVEALATYGELGRAAQAELLPLVAPSSPNSLRAAALTALGVLHADGALELLTSAARREPLALGIAAVRGLARLGPEALPSLREALAAGSVELQIEAAHALGQPDFAASAADLWALARTPLLPLRAAVWAALEALGLGPVEPKLRVDELRARLHDESAAIRRQAIQDLGMAEDPRALDDLRACLDDPDAAVRLDACCSLVALGEEPGDGAPWVAYHFALRDWQAVARHGRQALPRLEEALERAGELGQLGAVEALEAIPGGESARLLRAALVAQWASVRRAAAASLGRRGVQEALGDLLGLLGDAEAQPEVAQALAALGAPALAPLAAALAEGAAAAAPVAALALGYGRAPEALEPLLQALCAQPDALRTAAAQALGLLGQAGAVEALVGTLRSDPAVSARCAAATALAQLGAQAGVPALRASLGDSYAALRQAAQDALTALEAPPEPALLEAAELLRDERWDRLARLGDPARELLLGCVETPGLDPASGLRRGTAAETLATLGGPGVLAALVGLLSDGLPRVRLMACRALQRLGDPGAAGPLLETSRDLFAELRATALRSLEPFDLPAVTARIFEALDDPEPQVQEAALEVLARRDPAAAATRLAQRLSAPQVGSKLDTIERLVALGRPEGIDPILAELGDARPAVRQAAEQALRQLGWIPVGWRSRPTDRGYARWTLRAEWLGDDPTAPQSQLLLDALRRDPDPQRRRMAAEGLGGCGDPSLVPDLTALLEREESPEVQVTLCQTLVALGAPAQRSPRWLGYWLALGAWDEIAAQGEPVVAPLRAALADPSPARAVGALGALSRIPGAAASAALEAALHLADPGLQRAALAALADRATPAAIPRLVESLADAELSPLAVRALRPLLAAALPALEQAMERGPALQRRGAAAVLAGSLDPALGALLARLATDPDPGVRTEALRGLAARRDPSALDLALAALPGDADPGLRALAAHLLADLCELDRERALAGLRSALADAWSEVANAARHSLERCGAPAPPALLAAVDAMARLRWEQVAVPEALPLLLYVLGDRESDPSVTERKVQALGVLATLRAPAARPMLVSLLGADEGPVRAAAARALGALGDPSLAPLLYGLYDAAGDDAELRTAAVEAVAGLGPEVARDLLARALNDSDPRVRRACLEALGEGRTALIAELVQGLRSADEGLRIRAAQELGKTAEWRAIDPLVGALGDAVPAVRKAATQALLDLGWQPIGWRAQPEDEGFAYWTLRSEWVDEDPAEPQVSLLLRALDDEDPKRRRVAAEGLGLIGSPVAEASLRRLAEGDPEPAVRQRAALALGEVQAVIEARAAARAALGAELDAAGTGRGAVLRAALASAQPERRLAAVAQVESLPRKERLPLLQTLLAEPDLELRAQALQSLAKSGGEDALPLFVGLLDDPALAADAAAALGRAGAEAAELLAPALQPDAPVLRRRWAATAAGLCGAAALAEPLRPLLHDALPACRIAAAEALGRLGAAEDRAGLETLLATDPLPLARATAATALGALGRTEAEATLFDALADVSPSVADAALAACARLEITPPAPLLAAFEALRAGDYAACAAIEPAGPALLRRALVAPQDLPASLPRFGGIARTCAARGDLQAVPALDAALSSGEPGLQLAAAAALPLLGEAARATAPALVRLVAPGTGSELRSAALEALGALRAEGALELLAAALAEEAPDLRAAALRGLGRLGPPALPELRRALAAGPVALRAEAAHQLGRAEFALAADDLWALARSEEPALRAAVWEALESLGLGPVETKLRVAELCELLASGTVARRRQAAQELGMAGDPAALPALYTALHDPDAGVRRQASLALVSLGETPSESPEWIPYLLEQQAWEAVARQGEQALASLGEALRSTSEQRKLGAVECLGRIAGPRAEALLRGALADGEPGVRKAAARTLAERDARAALPELVALLGDPASEPEVATSLARFGEAALAALTEALETAGPEARVWAALALGYSGLEAALPPLLEALQAASTELRAAAARALGQLGAPAGVGALLESLRIDPRAEVREACARALAHLGAAEGIPSLRANLGHPYAAVREACREALEALGAPPSEALLAANQDLIDERWDRLVTRGPEAAAVLLATLAEQGQDQAAAQRRIGAATALGELKAPESRDGLQAALEDRLPRVRAAAVLALGRLGDPALEPVLLQCYADLAVEVRIATLQSLSALGVERARRLARAALHDPVAEVRRAALAVLGERDALAAVEWLSQQAYSTDPAERLDAIEGLHGLGLPQAVDALVFCLGDADSTLRRKAWDALHHVGWQPLGWRSRRDDGGYAYWCSRSEWLQPGDPGDISQFDLLLRATQSAEDPVRRRVAAEGLGLLRDARALPVLRTRLGQEQDDDVRVVLAESALSLGDAPEPSPEWLPYWLARGEWEVCAQVGVPAVPALAATLENDDEARRTGALDALRRIAGDEARAALLQAARQGQPDLRPLAVEALEDNLSPALVEPLVELLGAEETAAPAAALLGGPLAATAEAAVLAALRDPQPLRRRWAAEALGQAGRASAAEGLVGALRDEDAAVRRVAAEALGLLGGAGAAEALALLLGPEPEPQVREAAAVALGRIGSPSRAPALLAGLGDGWQEVREACRAALERIGQPASEAALAASRALAGERWHEVDAAGAEAVPLLLHVLEDPSGDPATRRWKAAALATLGRIGDPTAIPAVRRFVDADEERQRVAAIRSLGALRDGASAPALIAAFERAGKEPEQRAAAVWALGVVDRQAGAEVLQRALEDPVQAVRIAALDALAGAGEGALAELLAGLNVPHEEVRLQCAVELGKLGKQAAVDPLNVALGDSSAAVRRAADTSLRQLGWVPVGWRARPEDKGYAYWTQRSEWLGEDPDEPQVALLLRALGDEDPNRRRCAAEALGGLPSEEAELALGSLASADPDPAVRAVAAEALATLLRSRENGAALPAPEPTPEPAPEPEERPALSGIPAALERILAQAMAEEE